MLKMTDTDKEDKFASARKSTQHVIKLNKSFYQPFKLGDVRKI